MRDINLLDLNLLRVFETVMRERSVSLAAERLHITQSAVSNALNRLRAALDDPLFVRTRNGMEPTPLAISFATPVQDGLATIRAGVTQSLSFDPAVARRRFTIITTDVGEETYIAALLQILAREAPFIDLRVIEAPSEEYEKLLDNGEADFAIGRVEIAESFRQEQIGSCIYVAVICAEHAARLGLRQGDVIPYETFIGLPHVQVVPRGAGLNTNPVERALEGASRRVALTLPHTSVLSELIPGTMLVAAVPQPAAPPLCRERLLWLHLPFETEISRQRMIWHKRQDADKGHVWMREKIRSIELKI